MKYFICLPHIHRNGGIKVGIQQTHLMREHGIDAYLITPAGEMKACVVNYNANSPYLNYNQCKMISWEDARKTISPEDKIIYNWGADIGEFGSGLENKSYYLAQACFFTPDGNKNDLNQYGQPLVLKDNIEIVSVSREVKNYFLYGFKKDSRIINNWINSNVFYPKPEKRTANRVGVIAHRAYASSEVIEKAKQNGFQILSIGGTENDVAQQMQTCEYFLSCSKGIYNGWRESEGFPLPSAEAMACGCITISFENGGVNEYLQDGINGFISQINTTEDMVEKLCSARTLSQKKDIVNNAINSIKIRFNKDIIFEQMRIAYQI